MNAQIQNALGAITPFCARVVAFVIAAAAPVAAFAQHGTDPNWSAQLSVAKSSASVSASGAVANNMVLQKDGAFLIFYLESSGSKLTPYYVGSKDNGKTWAAPTPTVFAPASSTIGPGSVAACGDTAGNIHTVWGAKVPAGIFYARWDAKTQRWSDTVRLSRQIKYKAGFCNVTADRKGRVHAFWHDGENGTPQTAEVYHVRSENGGVSWSQQTLISKDDGKHSAFPIADFSGAAGDTLAIAWRDSAGQGAGGSQNWDLQLSTSADGGKTWVEPRTIAGTSDYESDPNLIVGKDGTFYIAFHVYPASGVFNARVMYGYSADGGKTWAPQGFQQISELNKRGHLTKEAYDFANNRPWFFWKDERDLSPNPGGTTPSGNGRGADIMAAYISGGGATVSKPEFLTDAGDDEVGYHNFIVGDDGIARAHYFIQQNNINTLYYTQRKAVTTAVASDLPQTRARVGLAFSPNPASGGIVVRFLLERRERVRLALCDVLGREALVALDEDRSAGEHTVTLDFGALPQAPYFLRLQTPEFSETAIIRILQ